ncbi:bifunctional folylpolyglutamate synthase/dihydrofolate synthase [Thermoplasmatales archaeon ex4572_165]|nr:MAG: bifunctional folylpolyglutamate synthase/dihydrofolate synthase [Thermoplasmatales archaeon ex4572_165]RLF58925.1 MAG: bifunctional folylpolyglutamate synthase/dihydrofolate synthase [Thermoplasmata archaeon]
MINMDYQQAVSWLNRSQRFGMKLSLNRIISILDQLNNPEKKLHVIHVAGTNGKGSVCRYISSILTEEGYQVGLFTSPHLESIRERICINNKIISKKDFSYYISIIKNVVDNLEKKELHPTYFEICTVLGFLFFKEKKVDYAIIEVGLGGRYDATNVVLPIAAVITNISYDHQHILGETLEEIAFEKAGIIKNNVSVITGVQGEALKVIQNNARKHHAPISIVKRNISTIKESNLDFQIIEIQGNMDSYVLETSEIGSFQKQNLSIAIYTIEQLQMKGVFISQESIQNGVKSMVHPGRMKMVHNNPIVLIDGAHNPGGIHELKNTVSSLFPGKKIILIFGVLKDKNVHEMIKEIQAVTKSIILTKSKNIRAVNQQELLKTVSSFFSEKNIFLTGSVDQAIKKGFEISLKEDIIIITGSLYTVQEVITYFKNLKVHTPNG